MLADVQNKPPPISVSFAPVTIENGVAHLAGWPKAIKADKKLMIRASSAAQTATD
jgi:hypothetical protein